MTISKVATDNQPNDPARDTLPDLPDNEFLKQFFDYSLAPAHFKHRGHLRLAWLMLTQHPLEQAVTTITRGIQAYAISLGDTEKFHYTLTEAIARIMHQRIQTQRPNDFDAFLANNYDIVKNLLGLLAEYYSDERLNSDVARQQFATPDRRSLDTPVTHTV